MNQDGPNPRQQLEASLTALLLGELSAEQAAGLREVIARDPELAKLHARLKQAIDLVRETEASPAAEPATQPAPPKLSDQRRQELLQRFKTVRPKEFATPRRRAMPWLVPVAAAVALVALLAAALLPALSKGKSRSLAFGTWSAGDFNLRRQANPTQPSAVRERSMPERLFEQPATPVATHRTPIVLPSGGEVDIINGGSFALPIAPNLVVGDLTSNSKVLVNATNIINGGTITMDASSLMRLTGQNIDLSYGTPPQRGVAAAEGHAAPAFFDETSGNKDDASRKFYRLTTPTGAAAALMDGNRVAGLQPATAAPPQSFNGGIGRLEPPPNSMDLGVDADAIKKLPAGIPVVGDVGEREVAAEPAVTLTGIVADTKQHSSTAPSPQAPSGPSNAYSLNVVGYHPVPAREEVAVNEKVRRQATRMALREQLTKAQSDLSALNRSRQLLYMKVSQEGTDLNLPKSTMVEIVDRAEPKTAESSTFTERLRRTLTGSVVSTSRIKLEPNRSDIPGLSQGPQVAGAYDPYFIETESEVLRSEVVLGKVIEDLKLKEEWSKKYAGGKKLDTSETLAMLRKRLDVRRFRDTGFLEIRVFGDRAEETAKIANDIAQAYRDHLMEERRRLSQGGIKALEERLAEQEHKVREAQQKVEDLRTKLAFVDAVLTTNQPAAASESVSERVETDEAKKPRSTAPAPIPQPEIQTRENAFSTFSLNVSDVSFKLAAASLEKGVLPEPASIRSEEFINAFDYRDPEPPPGAPVGFAWERARYPFAQNRDLLRFSLKTAAQGRQPGRPLNLVLLLDNSGSMERADRVRIIHEALRVLATQLQAQDKFSVVTFARTARLWVDGVAGTRAGQVAEEVSGLTPQGGTNLEEAMALAYQTALRHYLADGINRVVLLTDGAANLGNVEPEALKQKVEAHRRQGIALDCFGIGWEGYNDDLLEVLSRNGDGRYGFINTPEEAATEFAGQLAGALRVAAADVKVQVEFNPGRVTAYRQIGYAKHQLTKEQFRDNTVDAAELGAAESGNALYVVEVNQGGAGPLAVVRVRYKVPGTADYREQEWTVPYTGTAVALAQAGPSLRLAATASAFSEWLAGSPFATEVAPDALLGYLGGIPEAYGADARPKKLEWMLRQAKSVAGK